MHGQNPRLPRDVRDDGSVAVREVFATIQGEGPRVGTPAVFVRLAGCNLACSFCDTDFDLEKSHRASTYSLLQQVIETANDSSPIHPPTLVVITGGEPARQSLGQLVDALVRAGFSVQIETSGSMPITLLTTTYTREQLEVVVSPKTPGLAQGIEQLADAWKYIVEHDTLFAINGIPIAAYQPSSNPKRLAAPPAWTKPSDVFMQPCDHGDPTKNGEAIRRSIENCRRYGYRLSLQTHKILGLP